MNQCRNTNITALQNEYQMCLLNCNICYAMIIGELSGGWSTVSKMVTDQDREEETALHLAVEAGHPDVAKLCLDKGANVNAVKVSMAENLTITLED